MFKKGGPNLGRKVQRHHLRSSRLYLDRNKSDLRFGPLAKKETIQAKHKRPIRRHFGQEQNSGAAFIFCWTLVLSHGFSHLNIDLCLSDYLSK